MPSGRTHDRITWTCLPLVALFGWLLTRHGGLTLVMVVGFLFGGLMFGPDLDVRSLQSKRWGWLGWIWRPYRSYLRHRSWLSHGPLAGTLGRLLYLGLWAAIVTLLGLEITTATGRMALTWRELGQTLSWGLWTYRGIWFALAIGIEIGAMSHSLSDWAVSRWKRTQRRSRPHQTQRRK
ncbi:MAG: metal-binding protein [Cyanobacteria bacterium]|nr:metal-binding protein [Cyanobacteriota bacterium]